MKVIHIKKPLASKSFSLLVNFDSTVLLLIALLLIRRICILVNSRSIVWGFRALIVRRNIFESRWERLFNLMMLELSILRCLCRELSFKWLLCLRDSCFSLACKIVHTTDTNMLFCCRKRWFLIILAGSRWLFRLESYFIIFFLNNAAKLIVFIKIVRLRSCVHNRVNIGQITCKSLVGLT